MTVGSVTVIGEFELAEMSPDALLQLAIDANGGLCPCPLCVAQRWAVDQNLAEYRRKRTKARP